MLTEGTKAPSFTLADQSGAQVSLDDFQGRKVILYFYPKDDTPGCTTEAKNFQQSLQRITDADAVVLGVSPDTVESHRRFADKYGFEFHLRADPEHEVCEAYEVWQPRKGGEAGQMGAVRATYLIDEQGRIAKVWPKVKPEEHIDEVLAAVSS
jgi:peroxiredoxin Q/BCP